MKKKLLQNINSAVTLLYFIFLSYAEYELFN